MIEIRIDETGDIGYGRDEHEALTAARTMFQDERDHNSSRMRRMHASFFVAGRLVATYKEGSIL